MTKNKKRTKITLLSLFSFNICLFFLVFTVGSVFVKAAPSECQDIQIEKQETVYEELNCQYCRCQGEGDKLFTFFGTESNCFDKNDQGERFDCFTKYSYPRYDCEDKENSYEIKKCLDKYGN